MEKKIIGVFKTEELAILAIKRLKMDGYSNEEISVLAKHRDELDRIEEKTNVHIEQDHTKGAVAGAVTGGVLGGIGALLLELGVFAIPGVGPFLAAGPIAVTLTSIVAGGAVGGISGALIDMGVNENDVKEYEDHLNEGNILVLVDEKDNKDLVHDNFYENDSLIRDRYKEL